MTEDDSELFFYVNHVSVGFFRPFLFLINYVWNKSGEFMIKEKFVFRIVNENFCLGIEKPRARLIISIWISALVVLAN